MLCKKHLHDNLTFVQYDGHVALYPFDLGPLTSGINVFASLVFPGGCSIGLAGDGRGQWRHIRARPECHPDRKVVEQTDHQAFACQCCYGQQSMLAPSLVAEYMNTYMLTAYDDHILPTNESIKSAAQLRSDSNLRVHEERATEKAGSQPTHPTHEHTIDAHQRA